jgi:hypothetical protein
MQELIDIASKEGLKVKVWIKFKLADVKGDFVIFLRRFPIREQLKLLQYRKQVRI